MTQKIKNQKNLENASGKISPAAKNKIIFSGKRKTAVARAVLTDGSGKIRLNNQDYKNIQLFDRLKIEEPLRIAKEILGEDKTKFNVAIKIKGGGEKSQIEAARLALARAIIQFAKKDFSLEKSKELKEAYKPGDSKARSKRQTSYR